ncbi:thioredoxin [Mycoplasmoides genitalium M6320]|uniref:Thioredoxin n=1 Tax=Mycoplasmoides genitalium M6320 TaxID=662945 RepID=A0ABC7ZIP3_MYCGT|nr:thioredoxin [Mycoplasmoides genitalium M6320]
MVTEIRSLKQLEEIFSAKKNVIVDFWAAWCGPCKLTSPEFQKAADEFSDAQFVKVNVDDHTDIAAAYNITSLPTIVVFENGVEKREPLALCQKPKLLIFSITKVHDWSAWFGSGWNVII